MAKRIKAIVKPELLVWARNNAGYHVEEVARKLKLKVERLQSWERGEARPSISQLRKLGKIYKRPPRRVLPAGTAGRFSTIA